MKKFAAVLALGLAIGLAGCATTNDGRTGLRGEFCAMGYCLTPQLMTAAAVPVPSTSVVSGPLMAPATVVSQPAIAVDQRTTYMQAPPAPALPPPVSYNVSQLAK
jgi:hypothetical protein